jgi:hypothetical protein
MIKLIALSVLALFSANVFALEEKSTNEIDIVGPMIFIIPLTLLMWAIFIHYKNKKRVVVKKSYASTNVIMKKEQYNVPKSTSNKTRENALDAVPDVDITPKTTTRVTSAVAIDNISDDGEMSGGGSSCDFDFDWD